MSELHDSVDVMGKADGMSDDVDGNSRKRRQSLLARIAGNIASGIVTDGIDPKLLEAGIYAKLDRQIAKRAVNIAREILNELEKA